MHKHKTRIANRKLKLKWPTGDNQGNNQTIVSNIVDEDDDDEYENSDEEEVQINNNEDTDLGEVRRFTSISNTQLF